MIKETFRNIEYSDEKRFITQKNGKVELRKFTEDLVFAVSFDSTFDSIYSTGAKEPETIIGTPNIRDFDNFGFGQHGELTGTVIYDEESFRVIENEGSIKFLLKSAFNNAVGEQSFKQSNPIASPDDTKDYGITIYDDENPHNYIVSLQPGDDGVAIYNKLAVQTTGDGINVFQTNGKIRVTSSSYGNDIFMGDMGEEYNSLIDLFGGVDTPFIPNAPTIDVEFLKLSAKTNDANKITLTHKTDGHIHLQMYNFISELVVDEDLGMWSNDPHNYSAFELNWNEQTGSLFINGKLNKIFMTDVERKDVKTYLYLNGSEPNFHHIDGLAIYDKTQHIKNYDLETAPLTPYDSERPYLDIHYGQGFKENEIKDIIIDASSSVHFAIKIGVTWYYYFNGSWRTGDGSFENSTEIDTFEAKFAEIFFNENYDLIIRAFFDSDGWTPAYLDEISIIREVGDEAAAFVTGTVRLTTPVDLTEDSMIEITTDKGTVEVDLSSAAADVGAVTLEEIKQSIVDANIDGVGSVSDDGNQRLIIVGSTTGSESYISVGDASTASALAIIWGDETTDIGEDDETTTGVYADYSELFRWVRSRLGAPLVPVELTDEQLEDCLSEAVYNYNKWRNFKENIVYASLAGNPKNGWEIPPLVGGEENITEIILEPRYPSSYYTGRDDLMGNIFIQQIFNSRNVMQTAADHHISLVANRDLQLIMNTEVRWEVMNILPIKSSRPV